MVATAFVQPVLAVDIGEILVGLVALIFVIIKQLLEANKSAGANRAKLPVPPPPQPQQPNKGTAPAAGQQADPLRAQVEEFLRRAGRPAQPTQPRPSERPPQQAPLVGSSCWSIARHNRPSSETSANRCGRPSGGRRRHLNRPADQTKHVRFVRPRKNADEKAWPNTSLKRCRLAPTIWPNRRRNWGSGSLRKISNSTFRSNQNLIMR